jgi:hypothetical protein
MHGFNRMPRRVGIIAGTQVFGTTVGVPELEVGQVNVHQALHQADALQTVVGASVVDQRQSQAPFDGGG